MTLDEQRSEPDRIRDVWGVRTPHDIATPWPTRVDLHLVDGVAEADVERWVGSACLLCSNGCGLHIGVIDDRIVGVRGRPDDRVNHGRLGPKGLYGWAGQQRDRLHTPLVRDASGALVPASWDEAMGRIVARSRQLLDERGPESHGFYNSGQLMAEEYYTLAVIAKAGIGTPHMDGNTRLCTATAASALKESFGSDGQPGSYTDIEHCTALFTWGHNVAETQTVLWARILDRLDGPRPPALVCADPRRTAVAARADVHLAVRPGTNVALVNGMLRELIERGWVDHDFVREHTTGYDALRTTVASYTPRRVAEICGIDARDLEAAAELFGTADAPLSTVLQGFYQSHQATAAAVAVNDLHLLRGAIGGVGSGILQMNGQPTAQNNRECGAGADLPGFRNWANPDHIDELAALWDVDRDAIPHAGPPTHIMRMLELVEQGTIGFLWIAGTNPAVSLPDLSRVRRLLGGDTFVVVNDGYRTETTELADVVLPAAIWGEKQGTFTNVDRTVHLADQAVSPPGQARSDLDIWLDYARRMDLRTRSGRPLPWWTTPEQAHTEWRRASAGRPCDQSALTYPVLRERGGVQWPVTDAAPHGTERLYTDHRFPTDTERCETYGHDLDTGHEFDVPEHEVEYTAGRARLAAVDWTPPPEGPNDDYPLRLITGRTVYHFHTRTKTGRVPALNDAAPSPWAELSRVDAAALGVAQDDLVELRTPRGALVLPARITDAREGTVFVPFHYGSDAANELTPSVVDPVSKQPRFKFCGVSVRLVTAG